MGRWRFMRMKKSGKWESVGGGKRFGAGKVTKTLEGLRVEVKGDIVIEVPEGVESLGGLFHGWEVESSPTIKGMGGITDISRMYEDATIKGVVFDGLEDGALGNVTDFYHMFEGVYAPEGLDLVGLIFEVGGVLYGTLDTPWLRLPEDGSLLEDESTVKEILQGLTSRDRDTVIVKVHYTGLDNVEAYLATLEGDGVIEEGYIELESYYLDKDMIDYNLPPGSVTPGSKFQLLRDGEVYREVVAGSDGSILFGLVPPTGRYTIKQVA